MPEVHAILSCVQLETVAQLYAIRSAGAEFSQ